MADTSDMVRVTQKDPAGDGGRRVASMAATTMQPPTPTSEQARVIDAPQDEDMLVVAGAGSGKTFTMTERIIGLIAHGVPSEKILGLTFTRKAASELLGRVSAAVAGRNGTDRSTRSGASLFLKPEVLTYDAFFQSIVRRYGLLVGFDQNTQPLSEAGVWQLAVAVVDEHMNEIDPQDFGGFETIVKDVLALSDNIGSSMIGKDCTNVGEAIRRIRDFDSALMEIMNLAVNTVVNDDLGGESLPDEDPGEPKKPRRLKKDTDESYAAKCSEYERQQSVHLAFVYLDRRDVARKRDVLLGLVQAYSERKKQLNMAEFSDFTVAAYELVARFPSIGRKIRRQYTHVLLDEYQDTSTTQAQLMAALFHPAGNMGAGSADADSADEGRATGRYANVEDRSAVNAVGDPFQSIYAWRGASPGAFRLFIHDFGMPEQYRPYPLSVTRRNSRVVLEAANNLTEPLRLRPEHESRSTIHEVDVAPLKPMDNAPEGTLGVLGFDTLGQEIDAVARFARAAIDRYTPGDPTQQDKRPHVAVLFRSKSNMAQFAEGLENSGLSTVCVGYSAVLDRADVRDVLAMLHVVADHTDSASLMRLLATPRYAVGAGDLDALAALTRSRNDEGRLRALTAAGLVDANMTCAERSQALKDHRDAVPNLVYLADVLNEPELEDLLARSHRFSKVGAAAIVRAGRALRSVQANHSLAMQVHAAVEALGLDIDTVVAQAVQSPDKPVNPALAHSAFEALSSLVDTYSSEIAQDSSPTLRGFVGWVDSLKDVPDDSQTMASDPVDVALMTIHQAKGLEWDAVAVVGLRSAGFPSSQGDNLRITLEQPGSFVDGRWVPPQYSETARTWLEDPTAVPSQIRADAGLLAEHARNLAEHGEAEDIVEETPDLQEVKEEDHGGKGDQPTLGQEYGHRLHADERRLMYVALTRARHDALLTYSAVNDATRYRLDPDDTRKGSKASNFWQEALDSMSLREDVLDVTTQMRLSKSGGDGSGGIDGADAGDKSPAERATGQTQVSGRTLTELQVPFSRGIFVGEAAREYCRKVVVEAWNEPLEDQAAQTQLPWPVGLSEPIAAKLRWSADRVRAYGQVLRTGAGGADAQRIVHQDASHEADIGGPGEEDSLLVRAQTLVADPDLMPWNGAGREVRAEMQNQTNKADVHRRSGSRDSLDADVRRRGERLLEHRRQNVTDLQARSGHLDDNQAIRYWRGLVRPIPSVSSPAAQAGTRFHAWAERFVNAYDGADAGNAQDGADAMSDFTEESREAMVAELEAAETRPQAGEGKDEGRIRQWERRLVGSRWARRCPFAAERQIVVSVPQLGGQIINGKLDAVFYGGLGDIAGGKARQTDDAHDRIHAGVDDGQGASPQRQRYTIVDWKTGRKPVQPEDVAHKLAQLDMYRLLFSVSESVPLAQIDATLYYLSEPDESDREIHAEAKTQEQILAQLKAGVVEGSDND